MAYAAKLTETIQKYLRLNGRVTKLYCSMNTKIPRTRKVRFLSSLFGNGHAFDGLMSDPNQAIYGCGAGAETLEASPRFVEKLWLFDLLTTWRNDPEDRPTSPT
jgi:hypothetical protein